MLKVLFSPVACMTGIQINTVKIWLALFASMAFHYKMTGNPTMLVKLSLKLLSLLVTSNDRDPEQYRHKLVIALCHYYNTLRGADRFEDAHTLSRRHIVLFHQLYHAEAALDSGVAEYIHECYGTPPQWAEDRRG